MNNIMQNDIDYKARLGDWVNENKEVKAFVENFLGTKGISVSGLNQTLAFTMLARVNCYLNNIGKSELRRKYNEL